jgi:hypothetical protein
MILLIKTARTLIKAFYREQHNFHQRTFQTPHAITDRYHCNLTGDRKMC